MLHFSGGKILMVPRRRSVLSPNMGSGTTPGGPGSTSTANSLSHPQPQPTKSGTADTKEVTDRKHKKQKNADVLKKLHDVWREKYIKSQEKIKIQNAKILEQENYIKKVNEELLQKNAMIKNLKTLGKQFRDKSDEATEKLKSKDDSIKVLSDQIEDYIKKVANYEELIKKHDETIKTKDENYDKALKEKEELKDELSKSKISVASLKSVVDILREKCRYQEPEEQTKSITDTDVDVKIAELDGKVNQKIAEDEKTIKELEDELNIISDDLMTANEKLEQELRDKSLKISELDQKLNQKNAEHEKNIKDLQDKLNKVKNIKDIGDELNKVSDNLMKDNDKLKKELIDKSMEIIELQSKLQMQSTQNVQIESEEVYEEYLIDEGIQFDTKQCNDLRTLLRRRKSSPGENDFEISDIEDEGVNTLDTNNTKFRVRFDSSPDRYENSAKRVRYQPQPENDKYHPQRDDDFELTFHIEEEDRI